MQEFGLIPDLVFGRFPDGFGARLQWQAAGKTGWNHCPSWTTNTPSTADLNACHAVHPVKPVLPYEHLTRRNSALKCKSDVVRKGSHSRILSL